MYFLMYLYFIVPLLLLVVIPIAFLVYYVKEIKTSRTQFTAGCAFVDRELANKGFTVSRKIGYYNRTWGEASFYLYVDDMKQQWVMANPLDSKIDKIRNFNDLTDFDFFDNNSNTWTDKIYKVLTRTGDGAAHTMNALNRVGLTGSSMLGVVGTVVGVSLGSVFGASRGGGLRDIGLDAAKGGEVGIKVGSALGRKLMPNREHQMPSEKINQTRLNASGEYGLALLTSDCEDGKYLVFDFLTISGKTLKLIGQKVERNSRVYKKDVEVIQQMAWILNEIIDKAVCQKKAVTQDIC